MSRQLPKSNLLGRGFAVSLIVAAVAATFAGPALAADEPPPPSDSAVLQYAELVPTGSGSKASGVGKKTQSSLPTKAKRALDTAPKQTASALAVVATSSDYGAPATKATAPKRVPRNQPSPAQQPSLDRTLEATAAAVAPVGDARLLGLLVALVAIAVGGGALAARAHRS